MIEREIKDRVPTYPGRVKLTPVTGQPDTYIFERLDEPTEPGTPIDKATLDSIIQSRLTGRFYEPTVTRGVVDGYTGLTVSPLPVSGWVYNAENRYIATNGQYRLEVSSDNGTDNTYAGEAFKSSGWQSVGGLESWIEIYHTQALRVHKMYFRYDLEGSSRLTAAEIQGSTNGESWQKLKIIGVSTAGKETEYTLDTTGDFNYYRLIFTSDRSNRVTVKNFRYSLYDVSTYKNAYVLGKMPLVWDRGQRLTIYTPTNVSTFAVAENTLNGVKVNTILIGGRRYELRYNGTSFDVKEL